MNSARILEIFNVFGKLLYLDTQGDVWASGCRTTAVALQSQLAAAEHAGDAYAEIQLFMVPALNSIKPITQALDRIGLIAKAGIDNYIRTIAPEVGQLPSASPATILNALKTAMIGSGDDVAPSGAVYNYFLATYGTALPMNAAPSIADDIITVVVI